VANPTGIPTITGDETEGSLLTAGQGNVVDPDGIDQSTVFFSWHRNQEFITNGDTYTLTSADTGKCIICRMKYDDLLAASVTSDPSKSIAVKPTDTPKKPVFTLQNIMPFVDPGFLSRDYISSCRRNIHHAAPGIPFGQCA